MFQKDFAPSTKGLGCDQNKEDVIKEFPFPTEEMNSSEIALKTCETFCSTESRCWGCGIYCNVSCHYMALVTCKGYKESPGVQEGKVTQKPGTRHIYDN